MSRAAGLAGGIATLFERSVPLRFAIMGVANTAFSTLLFMLLLFLGYGVALGSGLALAAGIMFSYCTQGRIVFRRMSLGTFLRFVVAWTLIYLVNLGEIRLFMRLGLSAYLAGICATVPTTIVSYFAQKLVVFQDRTERPGVPRISPP